MNDMDSTIRPATAEEKFEVMKNKLIGKGEWNESEEMRLREFYGVPTPEKSAEELVGKPPKKTVATKKTTKAAVKKK